MIGVYVDWTGGALDPRIARRLAASLGIGGVFVGTDSDDGIIVASTCRSAAQARAWRPARTPDGKIVLFAGHIQNVDDLRRILDLRSEDGATLYAAAYARWHDAADLRVLGEFATLIVDGKSRRVRASRSPLLAPALHRWQDGKRRVVASTARAIFAAIDRKPEVDEQKIADSLYLNYTEEERDWFKGVTRIGIGTRVVDTPSTMTTDRYYDPATVPPVRFKRDADYVDAADAALREGTRAALRGCEAPAISLSGGLDSQAVAVYALAEKKPGVPLLGLTSVPPPDWTNDLPDRFVGDEGDKVRALGTMYPELQTELLASPDLSFDHKLDAFFLLAGASPRNTGNLYWIHDLYARAKARGCDVVLHGTMGNVSFSFAGDGAIPGWLARGRWIRLAREIAAVRGATSFTRALFSRAIRPHLPDAIDRRIAGARSQLIGDPLDWCGLHPAYAKAMRVEERARDAGFDPWYRPARSTGAWRYAALGNAMNEGGDVLPALEILHGVALRDPTAYRPLVELCLGMPDEQYLRDGAARWLARRLLRGRVPDATVDDRRQGVQGADWKLRLWRRRQALRAEVEALRGDPNMRARFDIDRLSTALDDWSGAEPNLAPAYNTLRYALPRALATARFIKFVDGANQ